MGANHSYAYRDQVWHHEWWESPTDLRSGYIATFDWKMWLQKGPGEEIESIKKIVKNFTIQNKILRIKLPFESYLNPKQRWDGFSQENLVGYPNQLVVSNRPSNIHRSTII